MKRSASLFALVTLAAVAGSALAQAPPTLTPQQRAAQIQQLQQLKQNARQLALQAAAAGGAGGAPAIVVPPFPAAAGTAGKGGAGGTAGTAGTAGTGGVHPVLIPAIASTAELAALQLSRPDRKKASAAALVARWGDLVKDDKAKTELKLHAQRVAYLTRIKTIATRNGAVGIANSTDQLLFEEEKRDFDAMTALKGGAK
ncbi:MAG TPA: hypothetical protein VGM29_16800 [Polyangiaceae bacterium]|jgi:hypothetical protein